MGKKTLLVVLMTLVLISISGHVLATFQPRQIVSEGYVGRVKLQTKSFPLVEEEQTQVNWLELELEHTLVLPQPPRDRFKARGIFITGWVAGLDRRMEEFIQLARETEINAFVIDVKDDTGTLSYHSSVPLVNEVKSSRRKIRDIKALIERLKKEDIYIIGRVASFKDPLMAKARPERALTLHNKEKSWADDEWISAFNKENWDYNIAISKEALELGFDEIQFDYVRFPALGYGPTQVLPDEEMSKIEAINSFLQYANQELAEYNAPISADIYGVVTSYEDVGIGQHLETLSDEVDIISPMVYPSHYGPGVFKLPVPNEAPYETIYFSMRDAIERLTREHPVQLRPWLQDFSIGHYYGVDEIRGQIQALYDLGIDEWLLWNPRSRYTTEAFLPTGSDLRLTNLTPTTEIEEMVQ